MCCYLTSCCCGLTSLKKGVKWIGFINFIINLTILVVPWAFIYDLKDGGITIWLAFLCFTNLLLILSCTAQKFLLLIWLICHAIQLIFSIVFAPLVITGAMFAAEEFKKTEYVENSDNKTRLQVDTFLPSSDARNFWKNEMEDLEEAASNDYRIAFSLVISILLPPWYLYCWIVVKSYYHKLCYDELKPRKNRRVPRTNRLAWTPPPPALSQKPAPKPIPRPAPVRQPPKPPPSIEIKPAPPPLELSVDKKLHDLDYLLTVTNMQYNQSLQQMKEMQDWQRRSMRNLQDLQQLQQLQQQQWMMGPNAPGGIQTIQEPHSPYSGFYQPMPQAPVYLPPTGYMPGQPIGGTPMLQRSQSFILRSTGELRPVTPTIFITKTK